MTSQTAQARFRRDHIIRQNWLSEPQIPGARQYQLLSLYEEKYGESPLAGLRLTKGELVFLYQRRLLDWSGTVLDGMKLDGATLANVKLHKASLVGVSLPHANLMAADLTDANLTKANLASANMQNACFVGATLTGTFLNVGNFAAANLTGCDLSGRGFWQADFRLAIMAGVNLTHCRFEECDFRGTDWADTDLSGADRFTSCYGFSYDIRSAYKSMEGCDGEAPEKPKVTHFTGDPNGRTADPDAATEPIWLDRWGSQPPIPTDHERVMWDGGHIRIVPDNPLQASKSDFDGGRDVLTLDTVRRAWLIRMLNWSEANLDGLKLESMCLANVRLRNASLVETHLGDSIMCDADLRGADLRGAYVVGILLTNADLREVRMDENTQFYANDLSGANLAGWDMSHRSWNSLKLIGADLRGVNMENADFRYCDFTSARLDGANLAKARRFSHCTGIPNIIEHEIEWALDAREREARKDREQDGKIKNA